MLISDLISEVLSDVAPKHRPKTQEYYFLYLSELSRELGHFDINSLTRKDYLEWMRSFKKRKERKTFNDYTKFLNICSNYAYQNKLSTHLIKYPTVDDADRDRAGRVYTTPEIHALTDQMNDIIYLQFILSYECFMRLREALHLTWDRVDLDNRVIKLRKQDVKTGTKAGQGRDIPMSDNAFEILSDRFKKSESKFVFPSPSGRRFVDSNKKAWLNIKRDAKIKGRARWHDIRHTALTHAILHLKLPIAHVSKVAGVSMRTLERVYLHHEIEHLRIVTKSMNVLKIA